MTPEQVKEACAKICDDNPWIYARDIAAAIRALEIPEVSKAEPVACGCNYDEQRICEHNEIAGMAVHPKCKRNTPQPAAPCNTFDTQPSFSVIMRERDSWQAKCAELTDKYGCNTAIMHARTAKMNAYAEQLTQHQAVLAECEKALEYTLGNYGDSYDVLKNMKQKAALANIRALKGEK